MENNYMNLQLLTPLLTFISLVIGAATVWGVTRATLNNLVKEVDRLRESIDKTTELFRSFETEVRVRFASDDAKKKRTLKGNKYAT